MFTAVLRRPVPSGIRARLLSTVKKRDLPDYNTTVDVANIKLSRPEKKSLEERQAKMLRWRRKDLDGKSLINDTLQEMEEDVDFQRTLKELKTSGKAKMTLEEVRCPPTNPPPPLLTNQPTPTPAAKESASRARLSRRPVISGFCGDEAVRGEPAQGPYRAQGETPSRSSSPAPCTPSPLTPLPPNSPPP